VADITNGFNAQQNGSLCGPQINASGGFQIKRRSGFMRFSFMVVVVLCSFVFGCRDVETIWSTESPSPDGQWAALARTDQYGGPGTAGLQSFVYLKSTKGPKDHMLILMLSSQEATSIKLELNWLTPSHLEIVYREPASIDFEAIRCGGIIISVRDLPTEKSVSSR
jgi:hypothetical protein